MAEADKFRKQAAELALQVKEKEAEVATVQAAAEERVKKLNKDSKQRQKKAQADLDSLTATLKAAEAANSALEASLAD